MKHAADHDSVVSGMAGARLRCDLLVFDLDGTLIDSRQDLANAVNAVLHWLRRPKLDDLRIASYIGDGAAMLVRRSLESTGGCDDDLMARAMPYFRDFYRQHKLDHTYVYAGAIDALRLIRDAAPGLPMAVLTNKPVRPSRAICEGLGLSEFFLENYGGDSFPTKKPDPPGLQQLMADAAKRHGRIVDPRRTVLVGDSHVDAETARAAGVLCLGCSYGLDPDGLLQAEPDLIVDSTHDWPDALRTLLAP